MTSQKTCGNGTLTLSLVAPQAGRFTAIASSRSAYQIPLAGVVAKKSKTVTYGRGSAVAAGAGAVTLTIKPSATAKKLLRQGKRIRLSVPIVFQAADGSAPSSQTESLTVKGKKNRTSKR